jgi:hypothetical protein
MAATLLHLNPFFPYLCFISSTLLCYLLLQEFQNCHILTSLSLFFFFLFPYLPLVQLVLLYNHFTIVAKSVGALGVYNIGTSKEGSRTTLIWVCSFMGNNAHEIVRRVQTVSTPLSFPLFLCFCFCLFVHLFCHHHHLQVVAKIKAKCEGQ